MTEERKTLKQADLDALDDEDFAYIDSNGDKHLPINDAAHVRAALARFNQTEFESADAKDQAAKKIVKAAEKFDVTVDPDSPVGQAAGLEKKSDEVVGESRADCPTCHGDGKIKGNTTKCPDCGGTGVEKKSARKPRGSRELTLQTKCRRDYVGNIEVRAGAKNPKTGASDLVELSGQVIGYDKPYEVNDMFGTFTETIHYGAATALLADPSLDVCFLVGHDASLVPLARTGAKASLELIDTKDGLQVRALVDPRSAATTELLLGLENGTIDKMSVGMQVDPAGDVWSGEDDYGMPNVRDIYRLANIFDASAVAFPANPATELELASARMAEMPPEVTVRAKRIEQLAREGRQGVISQSDSDDLLCLLRHLFGVTGERNAPTAQDSVVSKAIAAAHAAVGTALAAQAKDPDTNTDPVDKKVWGSLKDAHDNLTSAMGYQAKDGAPDASVGGPDGTQDGDGPDGGIGGQDGTGSRALLIEIERDRMRFNRPPALI
jgi:HK97 family phage prohead protease